MTTNTASPVLIGSPSRSRRWTAFVIGTCFSMVVNAAVVMTLVGLSCVHHQVPPAVETMMRFVHEELPPPSPPALPEEPSPESESESTSAEIAALPPLPSLDLPEISRSRLSVPNLLDDRCVVDVPLRLPAFVSPLTPAEVPEASVVGQDSGDSAAVVNAPIDLERFYPRQAKLRGTQGESLVSITVDPQGRVVTWTLVSSTPTGVFDQAVGRLIHGLQVRPGQRSGRSVSSTITLRILWTLSR